MQRASFLLVLLMVACGDDASPAVDAGMRDEGLADATQDASVDSAMDSAAADRGTPADAAPDSAADGLVPSIPEVVGECPDFSQETISFGGLQIDVLAGDVQDTRGPLLINWHGTGGNGRFSLRRLPESVRDAITAEGGMILAPHDDGLEREGFSPNGVWYETSDLVAADQLVACAVRDRNIDPTRIHVTGCSAGGIMGAVMTITRSAYVASSFLDSGGLLFAQGAASDYSPPVLTMHGGPEDVVIVNFQTLSQRLTELTVNRGGAAVDCNHLSGHCGAPQELRESGWAFVDAHRYGAAPAFPDALPASFPDYCVAQ